MPIDQSAGLPFSSGANRQRFSALEGFYGPPTHRSVKNARYGTLKGESEPMMVVVYIVAAMVLFWLPLGLALFWGL